MPSTEFHLPIEAPSSSPLDLLAIEASLSRRRVRQAMQKGAVWLSRGPSTRRLRRERPLQPGDVLHMYYSDTVLDEVPAPLTLIADENTYSLLYKPYGVRSQGSKWSDHCTVTRWAEQNLLPRRPAFPVHRLDRAASGLILVAHAKKTATALARQFEERSVEKRYRAIVHGRFQPTPEPKLLDAPIEGRDARTIVTLIAANSEGDRSLLDIVIETGRKHQIRRHLSDIGHPVIGDRMYGSPVQDQDLQLTAWLLAFTCPVSAERKTFQLPEERMPSL